VKLSEKSRATAQHFQLCGHCRPWLLARLAERGWGLGSVSMEDGWKFTGPRNRLSANLFAFRVSFHGAACMSEHGK